VKRIWVVITILFLWVAHVARAEDGIRAEIAQVNTARYPEVTLYVSVVDHTGQIVEGLEQDDFRITEDGVPVKIIAFSAGSRTAIATVLTIDRSGSMSVEGKLEGAKEAAETFADLMRPQDKAALVAFESNVTTLQPFTSDKTALKNQIRSLRAGGCTAWYDAVYQSVDLVAPLEGRRSVILLSDGIDCREDLIRRLMGEGSSHDLDEAIGHARDAGIPVYAIGLGQKATQAVSNEGFDEVKLRRVATETGGKFYHAPGSAELKQLYSSLSTTMQKEYVITYLSPRPTYDGTRRHIVVTVQRGGGPGATTKGAYLEQHLVNIRSDLRLFLAFLLPLLLLAAAPIVRRREKEETNGQVEGKAVISASSATPASSSEPSSPKPTAETQQPVAETAQAHLRVCFPLGPSPVTIGRNADNAIILSHSTVAPHHACIEEQSGRRIVRDLSNGQTYVSYRGDPAQERPIGINALQDGSSLRFGQVRAVFRQATESTGVQTWLEVSLVLDSPITIGRDPTNHIVVNSPQITLRQAEIRHEAGRWVVYNLGGSEGVLVSYSGDRSQARPVQGRNALRVGSAVFLGNVTVELQG
jgi:Ca-activated chloride channel family protein